MPATCEILRGAIDGRITLTISGEIDETAAAAVRESGFAAIDASDLRVVSIEMSGVTFVDSSGLGALVEARAYAADHGKQVVLTAVPPRVVAVITMSGLDAVFTLERQR